MNRKEPQPLFIKSGRNPSVLQKGLNTGLSNMQKIVTRPSPPPPPPAPPVVKK